ncbi:MAG: hypothetical protein K0S61_572 [Anaerocolumna sp.]|jgi:hypothetical protein|nr:hypothetical protein [Anaerocolumna sp.]
MWDPLIQIRIIQFYVIPIFKLHKNHPTKLLSRLFPFKLTLYTGLIFHVIMHCVQ